MKKLLFHLSLNCLVILLGLTSVAQANGFTEPDIVFYGEVRMSGGAHTVLLQSGSLEMTFVNQSDRTNQVKIQSELKPVGKGDEKPFSYAVKIPLAYLPEQPRKGDFLAVTSQPTNFKIENITINGVNATLPDGSSEFYGLSFASRSGEYRLDLLVTGDNISTANDGLPDWWKRVYGFSTTNDVSQHDPDGDGWTNIQEYLRGSNPTTSQAIPQLVTKSLQVSELGENGAYLSILDSNTADADIRITLGSIGSTAFQWRINGSPLAAGSEYSLSLQELKTGAVSIKHVDRTVRTANTIIRWHDGGAMQQANISLISKAPTVSDGSDATIWLDAASLTSSTQGLSTWPDRSGNDHSAMQPSAEFQPAVVNGGVDFSTKERSHMFFYDYALPAGNHTIFACYETAKTSENKQTLLSTNRGFFDIEATEKAVSYPGSPVFQVDGLSVRGYENTAGSRVTSIFRRDSSTLQNIFGRSFDGQAISAAEIEPVLPTIGVRRLADASVSNPIINSFSGKLHELLIFPSAVGEQKLRGVHDYIEAKWHGATIWDFSTLLTSITLQTGSASAPRIIRGGFGNDILSGSAGHDVISSGAGNDTLRGGTGKDRFVFGTVDTGDDTIVDFDPLNDTIDLSAFFWGKSGDARNHISVSLETNYSTPTPTIDSVLVFTRPDLSTQKIKLLNTIIGSTQLIRMVTEGQINMGSLMIPTTIQISQPSASAAITESPDDSFQVTVTRTGSGASAALDVPIGFNTASNGTNFVIDGATSSNGQRSVVSFARGETSKTLTLRPVANLVTSGTSQVEMSILPQHKFTIAGSSVTQAVTDIPKVWIEITQENATVTPSQTAKIRIHRDGSTAQSLLVDLKFGGTAVSGVHINSVPTTVSLAVGQSSREISFTARSAGLTDGAKVLLVQLASRDRYLLANPHEGLLYIGKTTLETSNAGFDRWVKASTNGAMKNLSDVLTSSPKRMNEYLQAYAFGLPSVEELGKKNITIDIVNNCPELTLPSLMESADMNWTVEISSGLDGWQNVSNQFAKIKSGDRLKLKGQPLENQSNPRFYRVNMGLVPGQLAHSSIATLTGSAAYGMSGNANWVADPSTGNLISSGGTIGDKNRIISSVSGSALVDFEMSIADGDWNDSISFFIDGVKQEETSDATIRFRKQFSDAKNHLLMWEFTKGAGKAVIRNLSK